MNYTPTPDQAKLLSSLKAQFALKGFEVHDAAKEGWLVARFNLSRYCRTIADLQAFAQHVGAE